ncbi:MAG: hypothetical protein DI536_17995 [Archangium gephyra]|uniref:TIGR02265 family protein n=1 Tax=Archangium gephyra TaxID=48 RepID=A0A2W5TCX8_9BACT|nr:MAG: hypothetical protein DI536_17995 [Archangium gephyra]
MTPKVEVVLKNTVESLFNAIGEERRSPELLAKLERHGLTWPNVPREVPRAPWNAALRDVAATLFPGDDAETAHFKVGRATMEHLRQTLRGKAQATMARVLGPLRVLEHFRTTLSTGANFSETRITREGERAVALWINETGEQNPGFFAGLLTAAVELTGAQDVQVKLRSTSTTDGVVYAVTWK